MKKEESGITLIALVVTIIVLLILAGVAISLSIGNNGLFTRAKTASVITDVENTKEEIKLEIMGKINEYGEYKNSDVIEAVKKITGIEVEENVKIAKTKKGNDMDISDLWIRKEDKNVYIYTEGELWITLNCEGYITWNEELVKKFMELAKMDDSCHYRGDILSFTQSGMQLGDIRYQGEIVQIGDRIYFGEKYDFQSPTY